MAAAHTSAVVTLAAVTSPVRAAAVSTVAGISRAADATSAALGVSAAVARLRMQAAAVA
jgi:hypothetical protein